MDEKTWQELLKGAYREECDLKDFPLTEDEKAYFSYSGREDRLKFLVNPYYASLAGDGEDDPVRRQFVPRIQEYTVRECELTDPLGESSFTPVPRLIHRYRDRALLLVTDSCAMYCRHCFRRAFAGHEGGAVSSEELAAVTDYLSSRSEVNEILLSGGDPLTCSDGKLESILNSIRSVRPDMVIRLATRIPVVLPQRITDRLLDVLAESGPLWMVTQFNHRKELTDQSASALKRIIDRGIPVLNQAVLLKGVNDTVEDLEELFQALVRHRVKPYYLFQGDLAAGTSHFRVSIEKGMELMSRLRTRISGLALPVYAVDMPGGGGKIPLTENFAAGLDDGNYYFRNMDGKIYSYPRE